MRQAEEQARRAADVVARLRRGVERPAGSAALQHLLTDALQALDQVPPRERSLSVRLQQDERHGALTVDDSGPGVAPEVLPRIFEPFFSTREHGLGLGLGLCESLAPGMGGHPGVQARSPRGAAFTLRLPLAAA